MPAETPYLASYEKTDLEIVDTMLYSSESLTNDTLLTHIWLDFINTGSVIPDQDYYFSYDSSDAIWFSCDIFAHYIRFIELNCSTIPVMDLNSIDPSQSKSVSWIEWISTEDGDDYLSSGERVRIHILFGENDRIIKYGGGLSFFFHFQNLENRVSNSVIYNFTDPYIIDGIGIKGEMTSGGTTILKF
ncbi:MAG: hypothetical protein ACTSVU_03085 [Promethearchaeota archaeon]